MTDYRSAKKRPTRRSVVELGMQGLSRSLDASTASWLAAEAARLAERFGEPENIGGLWPESDSSSDEEEECFLEVEDVKVWCETFGVRRSVWRSLDFYLSEAASGHGDVVWASGELLASRILDGELLVRDKRVLECGAGAGLPSIACARSGAASVTATDAPTPSSIAALALSGQVHGFRVAPLAWGDSATESDLDLVLAADCIYDPRWHEALLTTAASALRRGGEFVVAFAVHGNVPDAQVWGFFDQARGFRVEHQEGATQLEVTASMRRCGIRDPARARVHLAQLIRT